MSLRSGRDYARQKNEAYYTPDYGVAPLLEELPLYLMRQHLAWECAGGAGHVALELSRHFQVLATDLHPAAKQVWPVTPLDFLKSQGPSGPEPLFICTNPPYGEGSRQALAFLDHALGIAARRNGVVAMLLPFEFDARVSRRQLTGAHEAFAAKITVARRIRWLNIAQKKNDPMGHHSWFVWSFDAAIRTRLAVQQLRVA